MRATFLLCIGLLLSCTGGSGSGEGEENGACYPNQTCNAPLTCYLETCLDCTEGNCSLGIADGGPRQDAGAAPDAGSFICNNDAEIEPNNTIDQATRTGIPDFQPEVQFVSLAICPAGDIDVFSFEIETIADASVRVEHSSGQGQLRVQILTALGASIATGAPLSGNPDLIEAAIPNLPLGTYFAEIRGFDQNVVNNYALTVSTGQ